MRESRDAVRAWTLMDELVVEIHAMTGKLPRSGHDDLVGNLRACAVRGAVGLVRGLNGSGAELLEALQGARGMLAELRYHLYLARRLGLIELRRYRAAVAQQERVARCITEVLAAGGSQAATSQASRGVKPAPANGGAVLALPVSENDLFHSADG